jgi:hypothetical protein
MGVTLQPYLLSDLFAPAVMVFFGTLAIALHMTRAVAMSMVSAVLKAGFFLVYFGYFFHGDFTFKDDITYLSEAALFSANGVTIWNLFQHLPLILGTAGNHFIYQIFCTYALYIFGPGYFAPVSINILSTAVIAAVGCKIAELEFGLIGQWRTVTFFVLLFDPFIFAWSGLINGKDVLVLLGHAMMLYGFMFVYRGKVWRAVAVILPTVLVLFFLRFYVPLLFVVVFMLSISMGAGRRWLGRLLLLSAVGLGGVVAVIGPGTLLSSLERVRSDFVNPVYGVTRFLLTPIPFNTDPSYRFLEIPAVLYWLFLPLLAWGVILVARLRTSYSKFFLVYCVVFVSLYSIYSELQGPRHRLQLEFAIVVFGLVALRALIYCAVKGAAPASRSLGGRTLVRDGG